MAELLRLAYAIRIRCVVSALKTGATAARENPAHRISTSKKLRCLTILIVTTHSLDAQLFLHFP
jgi:hypothetical protein